MTSFNQKSGESQGRQCIAPAGYHERKTLRDQLLKVDRQAIQDAETRGAALFARGEGGGSSGRLFIEPYLGATQRKTTDSWIDSSWPSPGPTSHAENFGSPDPAKDPRLTSESISFSPITVLTCLGTPGIADGSLYQAEVYRSSAVIKRNSSRKRTTSFTNKLRMNPENYDRCREYGILHGLSVLSNMTDAEIERRFYGSQKGKINSFSKRSRSKIQRKAANCWPLLISQFCLTYGRFNVPNSGRASKKHLDNWLHRLRRLTNNCAYLWILEFQGRGAAHYHVFLSIPVSKEMQSKLTQAWIEVTGAEGQDIANMRKVHQSKKNWIPWDMKKGGYLTKYLSKSSQKEVPESFQDVGRFWATSRNLSTPFEVLDLTSPLDEITQVDPITGETFTTNFTRDMVRTLRRHQESSFKFYGKTNKQRKRKSKLRNSAHATIHIASGGTVIRQYFTWIFNQQLKAQGLDPEKIPF